MITRRRGQEEELVEFNPELEREVRRIRRARRNQNQVRMEDQEEHNGNGVDGGVYQEEAPPLNNLPPPGFPQPQYQQPQPQYHPPNYQPRPYDPPQPQQPYNPPPQPYAQQPHVPQQQYAQPPPPPNNHYNYPQRPDNYRTIQDLCRPTIANFRQGIMAPPIQANNFELKPSYIQMVQNEQYGGGASESPTNHLNKMVRVSQLIKLNGVSKEAILMRLFPFSLRGKAMDWYERLDPNSITSWNELSDAFLAKFFPPSLFMHLRSELGNFTRRERKNLYESWERFKDLIDQCPNHQIPKWLLVQTFYKSCTDEERGTLDASANGALANKMEDEAFDLIEQVASNRSMWGPRSVGSSGKYMVSQATKLESNIESMIIKKIDDTLKTKLNVSAVNQCFGRVDIHEENVGGFSQATGSCAPMDNTMDKVNSINNFDGREQKGIYSNTYNPSWRNHPNLSWGGNQQGALHGDQ